MNKRKRIKQQLRRAKQAVSPRYLASCYGKVRHTKESARAAAAEKPSIVRAYRCKYCPWYHIGRKQ